MGTPVWTITSVSASMSPEGMAMFWSNIKFPLPTMVSLKRTMAFTLCPVMETELLVSGQVRMTFTLLSLCISACFPKDSQEKNYHSLVLLFLDWFPLLAGPLLFPKPTGISQNICKPVTEALFPWCLLHTIQCGGDLLHRLKNRSPCINLCCPGWFTTNFIY